MKLIKVLILACFLIGCGDDRPISRLEDALNAECNIPFENQDLCDVELSNDL